MRRRLSRLAARGRQPAYLDRSVTIPLRIGENNRRKWANRGDYFVVQPDGDASPRTTERRNGRSCGASALICCGPVILRVRFSQTSQRSEMVRSKPVGPDPIQALYSEPAKAQAAGDCYRASARASQSLGGQGSRLTGACRTAGTRTTQNRASTASTCRCNSPPVTCTWPPPSTNTFTSLRTPNSGR
jgi:hypothetical protein